MNVGSFKIYSKNFVTPIEIGAKFKVIKDNIKVDKDFQIPLI